MVYAGSPIGGGRLGTLLEIAGAEGSSDPTLAVAYIVPLKSSSVARFDQSVQPKRIQRHGCRRLFGLGTPRRCLPRPYDLVRSVAIASVEL